MNLESKDTPLVLLCPAWKRWGTVNTLKPNSIVLHSTEDDVIPFTDSVDLLQKSGLPSATLIEVGSDHRLADESSLSVMLWACKLLASGETMPAFEGEEERIRPNLSSMDSHSASNDEASYICDACGEEIVIPIDLTQGSTQSYVEDCPVCCRANIIHVQFEDDGEARAWAEPEQDYT